MSIKYWSQLFPTLWKMWTLCFVNFFLSYADSQLIEGSSLCCKITELYIWQVFANTCLDNKFITTIIICILWTTPEKLKETKGVLLGFFLMNIYCKMSKYIQSMYNAVILIMIVALYISVWLINKTLKKKEMDACRLSLLDERGIKSQPIFFFNFCCFK